MRIPRMSLYAVIGLVAFAAGAGVGAGAYSLLAPGRASQPDLREFSSSYRFINPLLACGVDQDLAADEATSLERALSDAVARHEDAGDITDASVYFKDLNDGPWVGVNSTETFSPGSLLKVPLAISVYRQAEQDPSFLSRALDYTGKSNEAQHYPAAPLPPGTHTVAELVSQMLVQSDNDAANALANAVGVPGFEEAYAKLGIPQPPVQGADYALTTQQYGYFFRVLYDGTFVSNDDSEHILELLSKSTFTEGLVAGVPKGTPVAHKFGEREFEGVATVQLHDCGIVYVPQHPYLLCVMTRGADFDRLAATIADLSRIAYDRTTAPK